MQTAETVIITIGRNVNDQPMPYSDWVRFIADVKQVVGQPTAFGHESPDLYEVHTVAHGEGYWQGQKEDTYTTVLTVLRGRGPQAVPDCVHLRKVDWLRQAISQIGRRYGQEAIYFGLVAPDGVVPC
jgi:hypothetical protein